MSKKITIFKINFEKESNSKEGLKIAPYLYLCILTVTFVYLVVSSGLLQINESSGSYQYSLSLSTSSKYIPAQRGLILDRNLNILAKNLTDYSLFLVNKSYDDSEIEEIKKLLGTLGDARSEDILAKIGETSFDIKVGDNISYQTILDAKKSTLFDKYLYFINQSKRTYTYPEEFSHVIGYTGKTTAEDVVEGYSQFDQIGKYKLESQLEQELNGTKGVSFNIDGVKTYIPAESGNNIELSIDSNWQIALYKIIQRYSDIYNSAGGAGVIVDNSNGQVMALVSYPGIDTNLFINGISDSQFNSYKDDRKLPLIDKSIALQIAPGSTFKIITAYTLLENNIVNESTTYFSNRCLQDANFDFCEYHQYFYGTMDIVRALYKSSNLFFCTNSLKLEEQGMLDKLFDAEKEFGLGSKTGIDLVGELPGNIDTPEYKENNFGLGWYSGDTCNAVIGQGSNTVTPIQMALVAQAIANKGLVYKPTVINRITDSFGNVLKTQKPEILRNIPISDKSVSLINEGMSDVANYWDGTVYPFLHDLPGNLRVKTGTAEANEILKDGSLNETTHGWIVGSFDYDGKTYSFANVLNLGGGGYYVGQIMRDFINCLYSDFPGECK